MQEPAIGLRLLSSDVLTFRVRRLVTLIVCSIAWVCQIVPAAVPHGHLGLARSCPVSIIS